MKERGIILVGHAGIGMTTVVDRVEATMKYNVEVIDPESPKFNRDKKQMPDLEKLEMPFIPPLTRAERRKLNRKK